MNIKRIIKEEIDDFDWIRDIGSSVVDLFIDKAFHFDPIAEPGDQDYEKLVEILEGLGFISKYGTPKTVETQASGLYVYRDTWDHLRYVYTGTSYDKESYEEHIIDYAERESIDNGYNLQVVDARKFIKSL
jgi:hypothetical protein